MPQRRLSRPRAAIRYAWSGLAGGFHAACPRIDLLCPLITLFTFPLRRGLEDYFDSELNLPGRCSRPGQQTHTGRRRSGPVKDVRVGGCGGRGKVGVIENIEDLGTELHVAALRDSPDVVVLKQGE